MLAAEKQYEIHYYEVDSNMKITMTSIVNFFQDIFIYRSEISGVEINYVYNMNLTWIICKWDINVYEFPTYREKLKIRMIPTAFRNSFMNIKYEVFNIDEKKIIEADSLWCLVDNVDKLPYRGIDKGLYEAYGLNLVENKINVMSKINSPKDITDRKIFKPNYFDIDSNGHVNNAKYLQWLLECIPESVLKKYKLNQIRISYKKECKHDAIILVDTEMNKDSTLIRILQKITDQNNSVITVAETIWKTK